MPSKKGHRIISHVCGDSPAVSGESFPHEWSEAVASFDVLHSKVDEILASSHSRHAHHATENARTFDEVIRTFNREIVRAEEFYKFKHGQIRDKLAFLTATHARVSAQGEVEFYWLTLT